MHVRVRSRLTHWSSPSFTAPAVAVLLASFGCESASSPATASVADVAEPAGDASSDGADDASDLDTSAADGAASSDVAEADPCSVSEAVAALFVSRCGPGCHTGGATSGQVDLDPARVLTQVALAPGDAAGSLVVRVVEDGTMPPGGRLDAAQVALLTEWVAALDCTPTDPVVPGSGVLVGLAPGCTGANDTVRCNPITSTQCDGPGEVCDLSLDGSVECQPPPSNVAPGGACDPLAGPFCVAGHHCASDGICRAFCCAATDCGAGERCDPLRSGHGALGVCTPGT